MVTAPGSGEPRPPDSAYLARPTLADMPVVAFAPARAAVAALDSTATTSAVRADFDLRIDGRSERVDDRLVADGGATDALHTLQPGGEDAGDRGSVGCRLVTRSNPAPPKKAANTAPAAPAIVSPHAVAKALEHSSRRGLGSWSTRVHARVIARCTLAP